MSADPNFGFVIAAYAFGFFIVAGMILAILLDYRSLKRALARFPARSAPQTSAPQTSARDPSPPQGAKAKGLE